MNTKTDGISSGLVAVAEVGSGFSIRWTEPDYGGSCKPYDMLVRLSDAEAIIAQKDAEILEQCRINGMGAERELALRGQMERQDERIKGLEEQAQSLARSVMCDQVSNDSHSLFLAAIRDLAAINECLGLDPDDGGAVPIIDAIEAQSATLKLAKEVLEDAHQNINPERGYADELESDIEKTIAAINEVLGE